MRSFLFGLIFLLCLSYWCHLIVNREFESIHSVTVTVDDTPRFVAICECRCCLFTSAVCESLVRYEFTFNDGFYCHLCTDEFCQKNISESNQCHWMSNMAAKCFYYEHRHDAASSSFSTFGPFCNERKRFLFFTMDECMFVYF